MHIWETVPAERTVLFVLHNGTTLDRLLDVVAVFADDLRVRIVVTSDLTDPFAEGLPEQVAALGLAAVPWHEAVAGRWDLIVSASHHGGLGELTGPLLILAHGAGFGKYAPGGRSVFGLAPEWLLRDGRPFAAALGFAHQNEITRLGRDVPAALPAAALVGDPCFDDLLTLPSRGEQPFVVVSTTWGPRSLLGRRPGVLHELMDAGYDVRLIMHPNVWAWHGEHQLRLWLSGCLRDGLTLVPPLRAWRAELAAADCVVGDHGSVTVYGAALGKPTLLAAFADEDVVPGSPTHRLGSVAPRFEEGIPVRVQLDKAIADPGPLASVTADVTSVPGESVARLRATCLRLLDL